MKDFELIKFPIVKNIKPTLLADEIIPMTAEEVRAAMGKLFKEFAEQGVKVVIKGNNLPVRVFTPKENE